MLQCVSQFTSPLLSRHLYLGHGCWLWLLQSRSPGSLVCPESCSLSPAFHMTSNTYSIFSNVKGLIIWKKVLSVQVHWLSFFLILSIYNNIILVVTHPFYLTFGFQLTLTPLLVALLVPWGGRGMDAHHIF